MNINVLQDGFVNSPRLFQLADKITYGTPQKITLKNLHGSASQFVISAIFRHPACSQLNHLIVLNDAEEAAYFQNTLENLTNALDLFYFPSSFKNRKNFRLLNSSHVMLRTEALMKWSAGGNKKIIVTYPEALAEKVVLQTNLNESLISVKTGDAIDVMGIMQRLVDYNFERSDFVYEPGQFALRGGILDIYSFGNDKPYRFELFGNDVDSIRIFDPETQLSERKLLQVSIIPNVETQFNKSEKVSLLEFLPENTCVWLQDWDLIREKMLVQEEDLKMFIELQANSTRPAPEFQDDFLEKTDVSEDEFIQVGRFEELLVSRHVISFGYSPGAGDQNTREIPSKIEENGSTIIEFHTREQPSFNRQFDMLIRDLRQWESKKYSLYLFAENPKQLERLHSIFVDLKAEISFTPVPASIHEGFIDEDLKVICYTDHQIFQRYHKYKVRQAYNKNKAITLRTLRDLQPGDYVTHIDHGLGVYSGLQKLEVDGRLQEAVRIIYRDNDILYVNINSLHKISKYTGKEGTVPKVNKIGSDVWQKLKEKTKTRVKEIAFDLIKLYAARKAQKGFFAFSRQLHANGARSFFYLRRHP
jgi:transcription-repair coupling factor (superfamily II helicase)